MNDLIAKLYDQAIVIENGGDYAAGELDPVKFAKLIIEECISICDRRGEVLQKHLDENGENMADYARLFTEGTVSGSFRNAQSIRQHFGVE